MACCMDHLLNKRKALLSILNADGVGLYSFSKFKRWKSFLVSQTSSSLFKLAFGAETQHLISLNWFTVILKTS